MLFRSITIKGANDNPVAVNDYNTAKESLLSNGSEYTSTDPLGTKATGNVLNNDTDIDGGDGKTMVQLEAAATGTTASGATLLSFSSLNSNVSAGYYVFTTTLNTGATSGGSADSAATPLRDANGNQIKVFSIDTTNKTFTLDEIGRAHV